MPALAPRLPVKSGVHVKAVAVVEGVLADTAGRKTRKSKKDKKVVKEKVIINVVNDGRPGFKMQRRQSIIRRGCNRI